MRMKSERFSSLKDLNGKMLSELLADPRLPTDVRNRLDSIKRIRETSQVRYLKAKDNERKI